MLWMWPSSWRSTTIAVLTTCEVAAMYSSNGSSGMGGTNIGGLVRNSLSLSKACCTSGVHWNLSCFFRSLLWGILPQDTHEEAQSALARTGWVGPTKYRRTPSGLFVAQNSKKLPAV